MVEAIKIGLLDVGENVEFEDPFLTHLDGRVEIGVAPQGIDQAVGRSHKPAIDVLVRTEEGITGVKDGKAKPEEVVVVVPRLVTGVAVTHVRDREIPRDLGARDCLIRIEVIVRENPEFEVDVYVF